MIGLSKTFWAPLDATSKANNDYIQKCFGALLFKFVSPDFKLLIQNKMLVSVLLNGPLIWIRIAHTRSFLQLPC
jgi:hypothetical protein